MLIPHLSARVPFDPSWYSISGAKFIPDGDDQNNHLGDLTHLMRIAIEAPKKLPDDIVECS
jgi:hypothetical protein